MSLNYVNDCTKSSRRCKHSPHLRLRWYYDCKANVISIEPGNLVLAKAATYKGRREVKDWWEEELYEVEHRTAEGIPSYLMKNQWTGCSWVLNQNWLLLITPIMGAPLCTGVWAEWAKCAITILEEPTQKVSENEKVPQSAKCLLLAQHQTDETPLGLVNRKCHTYQRTFSGTSLPDQWWKVRCRGKGIHRCQCWHSGCGGTDHTDEVRKMQLVSISSIPPLLF